MNLKDYMDIINAAMIRHGYLKNPLPPAVMKIMINNIRKSLAYRTKCLECWNTADSVQDQAQYTIPADCLHIFDVWYNTKLLDYVSPDKMSYWRVNTVPTGVPTQWTYYGGENQPTGYIYLYRTPSEDAKVIKIHTIQLPVVLANLTSVCELPPTIQLLVEEGVKLQIVLDAPKSDPRLPWREAIYEKKVARNINTKVY